MAGRFLCKRATFSSYNHFDCVRYYGGSAPLFTTPALYCSGSRASPDCSELWYPDELDDYQQVTYQGQAMLCHRATGLGSSYGDLDCARYDGGDPSRLSFSSYSSIKCSPSGASYTCDTEYYPSELEGLTFATIGGSRYVCKDTIQGTECYRYYGGSPKAATNGLADLYCNDYGCDTSGYPSRYSSGY